MATQTPAQTAIKTYACRVMYTPTTLTVTTPGGKVCEINRQNVRHDDLPGLEQTLLSTMTRQSIRVGPVYTRDFTVAELALLASIRDKTTPVAVPAAPVVQTPPPPPAPVSIEPSTPINATAQTVINRTNRIQAEGTGNRKRNRRTKAEIENARELPEANELERLQRACKTLEGGELVALTYDIPDCLKRECPNPSWLLWFFGFRFNKSCWYLPRASLETRCMKNLLSQWAQYPNTSTTDEPNGVECDIIRQHPEEMAKIRKIARNRLERRIREIHTSLITRLDDADKRLQEAQKAHEQSRLNNTPPTTQEEARAILQRDGSVRNTIRSASDDLDAAISCASLFDDSEEIKDLLNGLRHAIRSHKNAQNAILEARGVKTI